MTVPAPAPRRGEIWETDASVTVLVVSSTVYNEVAGEPTVVVVPVFDTEPDAGFGVDLGDGWAAPGLISQREVVDHRLFGLFLARGEREKVE